MRTNIADSSSMETLSFTNDFSVPFNNSHDEKSVLTCVSSNVYYGYQPLRLEKSSETMHTNDLNKSSTEMDTSQCGPRFNIRKRPRDTSENSFDGWKKRRQNEPVKPVHHSPRCSPSNMRLEEDLLRETHGCSYYHWISNN